MKNEEHRMQVEYFRWCGNMSTQKGFEPLKLVFAIPNGGHRHIAVAKKMKAEGVKAGIPDVFLPFPKGQMHGLFIEFKTKKGALSPIQCWWYNELFKMGYATKVVRSLDEAREITTAYLAGSLYK